MISGAGLCWQHVGGVGSTTTTTWRGCWQVDIFVCRFPETWIESGFVKARVIHPDIRVTNGYVHLIDAVPGIPSLDVPNTIFCEDWIV